jgi:hypothetical protein
MKTLLMELWVEFSHLVTFVVSNTPLSVRRATLAEQLEPSMSDIWADQFTLERHFGQET